MWHRRKGCLYVILIGVLSALVLGACGGGEPTATPRPTVTVPSPTPSAATPTPSPAAVPTPTPVPLRPTPAPTSTRAAPKYGGRLGLRLVAPPNNLDVYDLGGGISIHYVVMSMLNQLIMPDPYDLDKTIGDLAESFEVSQDGKVYTFRLHRGVQWQDGQPFTAKDIVYNINRAMQPPTPRKTFHTSKFVLVERVEARDDFTVEIALKRPSGVFLPSIRLSSLLFYPAHMSIEEWTRKPVGTGPYKFARSEQGVSYTVNRNEGYFKKGLPYLDGLDYVVIADPALAEAAFRSGRFVTTNNGYDENWFSLKVDDLKSQFPDLQVKYYVFALQMFYFSKKAPWTDKRVRQALSLGFDRQEYVPLYRRGFANLGEPLTSYMLPAQLGGQWSLPKDEIERLPGFRKDKKKEDVAAAKKLLEEAGVDLSNLKPVLIGSSFHRASAEAIQAVLRQTLGIDAKLEIEQSSTERRASGNFDIENFTINHALDDPTVTLEGLTVSAPQNLQKWSNPKIDALFQEQDTILDPARRKQLVYELQREAYDWAQPIPLAWGIGAWGYRSMVRNVPLFRGVQSPFFKWEQVWLDR